MNTDPRLVRVELMYAVYGIVVKDGIVIDAAPIAKWMVGRKTEDIRTWLRSKGAKWSVVD